MAFSFAKKHDWVNGSTRLTQGTFTNSGTSGGDIYTGLQKVYGILLQQGGAAVVATEPKANESFPATDPITIVTTANASGWWMSWGV